MKKEEKIKKALEDYTIMKKYIEEMVKKVVKDERTTETCDAEQGECVEAAPMTISELNEFTIRKTYAAMDQTLDTLMKNEDIRTKVKIETLIQLLLVLKDCRCL